MMIFTKSLYYFIRTLFISTVSLSVNKRVRLTVQEHKIIISIIRIPTYIWIVDLLRSLVPCLLNYLYYNLFFQFVVF